MTVQTRKKLLLSSLLGLFAASITWSWSRLTEKQKRKKEQSSLPVNKAGQPDPLETADNKMVYEGSQYGVQYYNEKKQNQS